MVTSSKLTSTGASDGASMAPEVPTSTTPAPAVIPSRVRTLLAASSKSSISRLLRRTSRLFLKEEDLNTPRVGPCSPLPLNWQSFNVTETSPKPRTIQQFCCPSKSMPSKVLVYTDPVVSGVRYSLPRTTEPRLSSGDPPSCLDEVSWPP